MLSIHSATAFITRCISQLWFSCVATSCMNGLSAIASSASPGLRDTSRKISSRIRPSQWMWAKKQKKKQEKYDNAVGVFCLRHSVSHCDVPFVRVIRAMHIDHTYRKIRWEPKINKEPLFGPGLFVKFKWIKAGYKMDYLCKSMWKGAYFGDG